MCVTLLLPAMFGSVRKMVSAFETRKQPRLPSTQVPSPKCQAPPPVSPFTPVLQTSTCVSNTPEPRPSHTLAVIPSRPRSPAPRDGGSEVQEVILRDKGTGRRIPRVRLRDSWPIGKLRCSEGNVLSSMGVQTREPISCSRCPPEFDRSRLRPIRCRSSSTSKINSTTGTTTGSDTGPTVSSATRPSISSVTEATNSSVTWPTEGSITGTTTRISSTTELTNTICVTEPTSSSITGPSISLLLGHKLTSIQPSFSSITDPLRNSSTGRSSSSMTGPSSTYSTGNSCSSVTGTSAGPNVPAAPPDVAPAHPNLSDQQSGPVLSSEVALGSGPIPGSRMFFGSELILGRNLVPGSGPVLGSGPVPDNGLVLIPGSTRNMFGPAEVSTSAEPLCSSTPCAVASRVGRGWAFSPDLQLRPSDSALFSLLLFLRSGSSNSTVAIDNKIEQAMDLVKAHLMLAVREEVELLREQIKELTERNAQLERENSILRALRD